MIQITNNVFIDEKTITLKASRSSGPGGQNVNKVNTRITLFFDVTNCENLSGVQKRRILTELASRADKNGVIGLLHKSSELKRKIARPQWSDCGDYLLKL
jgi:ribosome-associated protein